MAKKKESINKKSYIFNKNKFPENVPYDGAVIRLSPRQQFKVDISKLDIEKLPNKVIIINK